ncbi:hypothetical protein DFH94DRAFT_738066 [Russula ochroleuca]|uniref:MARVEL domain-containing protein n=1 Tax=Russula ochroleuca TaxID=152965 RepID=A0A9P5T9N9_9AGAM|nr:hypothetical protein DFH94DRAFT_738066 [Russula ochroleuca]
MLQFLPDSTVLFALAVSSAAMELGLTAYLMIAGTHVRGGLYHSLQIIFLFDALWTVLFLPTCVLWYTKGSLDVLANLFGSICWIFAAAIVWGSAIGSVHNKRARKSCTGMPSDLRCTHYISPGSLAWMEFVLCIVTLILAILWVRVSRFGRGKVSSQSYYRSATIQHHLRFDV